MCDREIPRLESVLASAKRSAGPTVDLFTDSAWKSMGAHLEERWHETISCTGRKDRQGGLGQMAGQRPQIEGRRAVVAPVRDLIDRLSAQWVVGAVELVRRVSEDYASIAATMSGGISPGRVSLVRLGLGDPHDGGRTTGAIEFESGLRLVYKPRSVGLLRSWGRLIRDVEPTSGAEGFILPSVIDRGTHGWVSWIESKACFDAAEASLFCRRAGIVAALAYALGASDLHAENVIRHGASPVIIDAETLLWVEWRRPATIDAVRVAAFDLLGRDSVLRTGLFPRWQTIGIRVVDASALGSAEGDVVPPELADEVADGLEAGYAILTSGIGRRAVTCFLSQTKDCPSRAVLRPTSFYRYAIEQYVAARTSTHLTSADVASLALPGRRLGRYPLGVSELVALQRLDVPRFTVKSWAASGPTSRIDLRASRGAYVRVRMAALDDDDLEWQLMLARASLALRKPLPCAAPLRIDDHKDCDPPSASGLIYAAESLGRVIMKGAIRRDGALLWITRRPVGSGRTWHLAPADFGLYDGNTGTAAFLAALWHCTGDECWRSASKAALRPVRDALCYYGNGSRFVDRFGVGGAEGLGGVLFGLSLASRLFGDEERLRDAMSLLRQVDRATVGRRTDFLYGSAGLISGALAAYDQTGEASALEAAVDLGRHLAREVEGRPGFAAERRPFGHGFAHGRDGVAAALGRLYARTGDDACGAAAIRLMEVGETPSAESPGVVGALMLVAENGAGSDTAGSLNWCRGAAGRLVACWSCADAARSGGVARALDRERARLLHALIRSSIARETSLCCGLAGRLDVLLEAERREPVCRGDLQTRIASIAATLLACVPEISPAGPPVDRAFPGPLGAREVWPFAAGLYGGLSGVGYAMLRAARSEEIPSPLLWWSPMTGADQPGDHESRQQEILSKGGD